MKRALATLFVVTGMTAAGTVPAAHAVLAPARADLGLRVKSLPSDEVPGPSRKLGTYKARILIDTRVRNRPGGKNVVWNALTKTKWSGSSQVLMVLASRIVEGETWLKVRLPIRPNRAAGWIPRDRVNLSHTGRFIEVDRSRRLLRVYADGKKSLQLRVVVGERSTPTPVGLFALHDRIRQADPNGFIGPWAFHLTAHSRVLRHYDGGPGRVAFHGRDGASLSDPLGSARSHGCIRMNNSRISRIVRYSLGTAVRIRK